MFGNLPIGKVWGQFTSIFVIYIVFICALDPNPQSFVVMWEIKKIDIKQLCTFHAISIKIVFSDMVQCPSPWAGDCLTLNLCTILSILCNFQQFF